MMTNMKRINPGKLTLKRLGFGVVIGLLVLTSFTMPSGTQAKAADDPCTDAGSSACQAAMQADPAPAVTEIAINADELNAYTFFHVLANTSIYDAPNGNVIGQMANGFNFVAVYERKDGFARLRDGTWVPLTSLKAARASSFSGITFDQPLPYPMAWVVQASIPSNAPGAPNNRKTPAIARYTRVYIYETVHVGEWDWYLVGPGQWLEQRKVARVLTVSRPDGATDKWVSINLYEQVLTAYEGDKMVFATLISSGLPSFYTNVGTFQVWSRQSLTPMSGAMGGPNAYSLPDVPYVMYFDHDISLHGTYWHDGFGFKHSHGCVNMTITDAEWVWNWSSSTDSMTVQVLSGKADTTS